MPSDWARRAYEQLRTDQPRPLRGSDFYGSSDNFREWLREERADLCVDEVSIVPLAGMLDWTPGREMPVQEICPYCNDRLLENRSSHAALAVHRIAPILWLHQISGVKPELLLLETERPDWCPHCHGRIKPGSHLYCPRCYRSGFDRKLWRQIQIVGCPPASPEDEPAGSSRREQRQRKFAKVS